MFGEPETFTPTNHLSTTLNQCKRRILAPENTSNPWYKLLAYWMATRALNSFNRPNPSRIFPGSPEIAGAEPPDIPENLPG